MSKRRLLLGLCFSAFLLNSSQALSIDLFSGFLTPEKAFSRENVPPKPNYDDDKNWAALPERDDNADIVPNGSNQSDNQATAEVDAFYIHPTSYLLGNEWNAATSNVLANLITDYGMLPQQAAVYNGVARVYAPRYRQASQGAQVNPLTLQDRAQALALAYGDIQRAFDHFLDNANNNRPFIIGSHSQGTTHAIPLLRYLFTERPQAAKRMIAAYIIGNTVDERWLSDLLPVCQSATDTGCYISWNAIAEGGDDSHWKSKGQPVCVNPLSWKQNEIAIDKNANRGSLPVTGPYFLDAPHPKQTGAQCKNGILWITPPTEDGYDLAIFPGGGYHAYDYNLFWMNLRLNLSERVHAFEEEHTPKR